MLERVKKRDQETLRLIYKAGYPMVEKYILNNRGSKADAEDIFQDAFYLFIKKAEDLNFSLTAKPETFIFGISRNLWLKQLTKHKLNLDELAIELTLENEEDGELLNKVKRMKNCLLLLGEPCRSIIEHFYFLGTSMKKIAEMFHYTNADNAKNQKYKCFIRLKKLVLEQPNS